MKGEYWFNSEPISKTIDIFFENKEYQFINQAIRLFSIEELKDISNNIRESVKNNYPFSFVKEYVSLRVDFGLCTIKYELPNQSYECHIDGDDIANIFERYVYKYEHFEDRFKSL